MPFDFMRELGPSKESRMANKNEDSKATIYVRVGSQIHRKARIQALNAGMTMGQLVEAALAQHLGVVEQAQLVSP
jgi:predicted HicB family RNase H-like nuclease